MCTRRNLPETLHTVLHTAIEIYIRNDLQLKRIHLTIFRTSQIIIMASSQKPSDETPPPSPTSDGSIELPSTPGRKIAHSTIDIEEPTTFEEEATFTRPPRPIYLSNHSPLPAAVEMLQTPPKDECDGSPQCPDAPGLKRTRSITEDDQSPKRACVLPSSESLTSTPGTSSRFLPKRLFSVTPETGVFTDIFFYTNCSHKMYSFYRSVPKSYVYDCNRTAYSCYDADVTVAARNMFFNFYASSRRAYV